MNEYGLEFPAGKMVCFAARIAANAPGHLLWLCHSPCSALLARFTTKKQRILTLEKQHMICSELSLVVMWVKTAFGDL